MDYQRIFILLGLAVTSYMLILAWNEDYGDKPRTAEVTTEQTAEPTMDIETPGTSTGNGDDIPTVTSASDELPTVDEGNTQGQPVTPLQVSQQTVVVETDVLNVTIDLAGGDIVKSELREHLADLETPDIPFVLINPEHQYSAQSGLIGPSGTDGGGSRPVFSTTQSRYELGGNDSLAVNLDYTTPEGVVVTKQFLFRRGDYLVDMKYEIQNNSKEPFKAAMFGQLRRDSKAPVNQDVNSMGLQPFVGGATRSESEVYTKLEFDDVADEPYKARIEGGYMAMVQHYFVSAWIPSAETTNTYQARKLANRDTYLFSFQTPLKTIEPGANDTYEARFYTGPKDQYRLQEITQGLDLTVDYGFLWWLAQPLFYLLTILHGFVNNWGMAIILLTIVVKTLLYPLSAASFKSMAKMRKLQPEMVRLKERYGDDRQKFSQEMMELYKKEGANPLGGCFPILLQMPVFLALYWALMESVELRHAPFILWIDDLSVMDPYFVLPILMGISMYLTQLMQPEPPDPMQAKVFKLMPIMFTFFFLWFPSGLVLYWLINNILSIAQQYYVTRQIEKAG